jgi:dTMP kinase
VFISIEGPEGAGKTTLAVEIGRRLTDLGRRVLLTYEPGGTALGREVRRIVRFGVGGEGEGSPGPPLDPRAEALLFLAARAQLVSEVLLPRLRAGEVVVCDRYADSTLAYQCFGRGLPREAVRPALDLATQSLKPDLTFLLDLEPEVGLRRNRGKEPMGPVDRFEVEDLGFHQRVREGYLTLAREEPDRWVVFGAERPALEIAERAWSEIRRRLEDSRERESA